MPYFRASPLARLACLALLVSSARAETDAAGNILPTGYVAVDLATAYINALNKEVRELNDSQRVLIERKKIAKKMDERLAQLQAQLGKVEDARRDVAQKRHNLAEDRRNALSAAGGDRAKEEAIEKEFQNRTQQLTDAEAALARAPQNLTTALKYYEMMNGTLKAIPDGRDADAYWNGGMLANGQRANGNKYTFLKQKELFEGEWRKVTAGVNRATTLIGTTSALDTKREGPGKWKGEITAVPEKLQFTVNGVKVERVGQPFPIGEDRTISIRVQIMDARRKQALQLKDRPPVNVKLEAASEYRLAYYQPGGKSSDWRVTKEEYEWRKPATRTGRSETEPKLRSSGPNPRNDCADLVIDPDTVSDRMRLWVRGEITWTKDGKERNEESAQGELAFSINPPR